ncbi:MAG: hypothetical protein E7595_01810 [Ruminococcaceae bacterium]|nr:hypothetical protein [Oscillospiraceae bacterium]
MKTNDIEKMLIAHYKQEEKSIIIPNESEIKAFSSAPETKRNYRIKYIAAVAACVAVLICAVFIISSLGGYDETSVPQESEDNTNTAVADWYEPGEFKVNHIAISQAKAPQLCFTSPLTYTLAPITAIEIQEEKLGGELPEWVARATILNERYIQLIHDYHNPSKDYILPVYDIQTDCLRDIVEEIYLKNKKFIDSRNANERDISDMIYVHEFGASTEWGLFDIWDESVYPIVIERFMVNIESGEMKKLPNYNNVFAVSSDYRYLIMNSSESDGHSFFYILDSETMSGQKTDIRSGGKVSFSPDGRYAILYELPKSENGGWNSIKAEWHLYELESGKITAGKGKILRFTDDGNAVITKDKDGAHIYLIDDMSDVTDSYPLKEYEKYLIKSDIYGIYREPIFDTDTEIVIQADIECSAEWNGYRYFYLKQEAAIAVYSEKNNEIFYHDISDLNISEREYHEISIYITDGGKSCNLLTFYDDFFGKYAIYEGIAEPKAVEIELPDTNEEVFYEDGFVLYESPEGYKMTIINAFRQDDIIDFVFEETEYEMDIGIVFINGDEMFIDLNRSVYEDIPDNIYTTSLLDKANGLEHTYEMYLRKFKLLLGEEYDESEAYYMVLNYHVITENGKEIRG